MGFLDLVSEAIDDNPFEEKPVTLEEFIASDEFMNLPPLSHNQLICVKAMTQIFSEETLIELYGEEAGRRRYKETFQEVVLALSKGSGKNHMSTIALLYVLYQLLCLKDPAAYFGKPSGNNIDLLNVAVNSDQAKNAFFNPFVALLKQCKWFDGKYNATKREVEFDKNITVYSGNSEHGAQEGLNLFMAILDEIAGFDEEGATERQKTSWGMYNALSATVQSRFSDAGKVLMLSFPRFKGDFILTKYEDVIAEKIVHHKSATLKLDQDLPDGFPGNEIKIEWEDDEITRYTYPGVFAMKKPTWEVNPLVTMQSLARAFYQDYDDAMGRFCAMPSTGKDKLAFKNQDAVDTAMVGENVVNEHGILRTNWKPKKDTKYYVHVDLSKVHDRCSVAFAHVDGWVEVRNKLTLEHEVKPEVIVDGVRWWKPSKEEPMDFSAVVDFIVELRAHGCDIELVTFDRWSSQDTRNYLEQYGFQTELLSVATKHYGDFMTTLYDGRLLLPYIEEFRTELRELRWVKGNIDHPSAGYKDISDSVCGAIFNAVAHTPVPLNQTFEVLSIADVAKRNRAQAQDPTVIRPPSREPVPEMPQEIASFIDRMKML